MNVLIDNREKKSRVKHAITFYEDKGDTPIVKELAFGDYIFENKVVFEYKTISDFIQSVKKGRIFNQAIDQSTAYKYHFVIIVATEQERFRYINKLKYIGIQGLYFDEKQYLGAVARLNTYTTVMTASCEEEAFEFMRVQARKCLDDKSIVKRLETKTDNPAFNWLMNIKHISDKKAKLIVEELNLYSLQDLLNITNNDLQAINGIGSQTAGIIMKSITGGK